MNYAQDALFWRLTNPTVRDLATLLTAPPLWHNDTELPVRLLLGEHGFRYLLELNDHPQRLPENLHTPRLGHYAENLLAFWLQTAPHCQLIAREVPIVSGSQTQGALDCIASLSGNLYHIELTCKYYGSTTGQPENMVGLNPRDTLLAKHSKIQQQLTLSQHPAVQHTLRDSGIAPSSLQRASIIRGIGFTLSGSLPEHPLYPANAWTGILLQEPEQWQMFAEDARFYVFQRHEYLAPARVTHAQSISKSQAQQHSGCLLAYLAPRPDAHWHEVQRLMLPENK